MRVTTATLDTELDPFTVVRLSCVMERLDDNGLYAVLTYNELRRLADTKLDSADDAFRMVVVHRWEWIVNNITEAYYSYMSQCEDGCMWAAIMQVVGEYQAHYLAATVRFI